MLDKKFNLGGIQTRPNRLVQDPDKSRYNKNVLKDHSGIIRKRFTFTKNTFFGTSAQPIGKLKLYTKSPLDAIASPDDLLIFSGVGPTIITKTSNGVTFSTVPALGDNVQSSAGIDVKCINNVAYWNTPDGLWKYDGLGHYRSGMPALISHDAFLTDGGGAGTGVKTYRAFLVYLDHQNQTIMGDYFEFSENLSGAWKAIFHRTTEASYNLGYDFKYFKCATLTYSGTGDMTIVTTAHNLLVNDWVCLSGAGSKQLDGNILYKVRVKSVAGLTIVLDAGGISYVNSTGEWALNNIYFIPALAIVTPRCFSNIAVAVYNMGVAGTLPQLAGVGFYDNTETFETHVSTMQGGATPPFWSPSISSYFADSYDIAYRKLPFIGTDSIGIAFYNNLLLLAKKDRVEFSNIAIGSTVEDSDGLNFFEVGTSEDGDITAVFANNDYVVVHRQRETYYITGNIFTGVYRVQSLNSTFLGSKNQISMCKLFGQNFHYNIKGAYIISGGGKTEELTDDIESMFTLGPFDGFNFKTTAPGHTVVYSIEDTIVTYFFDGVQHAHLCYNYNFKDWFIWRDLDTSGGMEIFKGILWVATSTTLHSENTLLADYPTGILGPAVAVDGIYETTWQHSGEPSLSKKYERVKIHTDEVEQNMIVKTKIDFNEAFDTNETLNISMSNPLTINGMAEQGLNRNNYFSIAIRVENNEVGKDLALIGLEIDIRGNQTEIKR